MAAALVAVVLCLIPGIVLLASASEQSGGSSWRLILALTVSSPVAAFAVFAVFAVYGVAAAATSVWGTRSGLS